MFTQVRKCSQNGNRVSISGANDKIDRKVFLIENSTAFYQMKLWIAHFLQLSHYSLHSMYWNATMNLIALKNGNSAISANRHGLYACLIVWYCQGLQFLSNWKFMWNIWSWISQTVWNLVFLQFKQKVICSTWWFLDIAMNFRMDLKMAREWSFSVHLRLGKFSVPTMELPMEFVMFWVCVREFPSMCLCSYVCVLVFEFTVIRQLSLSILCWILGK